ncbi:MAG: hypothetical protein ACRDRK_16825 [Pseudonocardia sp.]
MRERVKTHLFCDVAWRRLDEGRSILLLLGQDFDTRNLLSQFAEITQLDGPAEAAIACFAPAAEASGHLGLMMIDALNESDRPERWRDDLRALLAVVNRYENIAVAVSYRVRRRRPGRGGATDGRAPGARGGDGPGDQPVRRGVRTRAAVLSCPGS